MRKPSLAEKVLEGLCQAYSRMEADDLKDLAGEDAEAFKAAEEWLTGMYAWREEKGILSRRRRGEKEAAEAQRKAAGLPPSQKKESER